MSYQTEQENFWSGEFGEAYIGRNQEERMLNCKMALWSRMLRAAGGIGSAMELGCNIGLNLQALKKLRPELELSGTEINAQAAAIARTQLVGRLLLPVYLYHVGLILRGNLADARRRTDRNLTMWIVDTSVLLLLLVGCSLVAAGLRSRTVALSLAVLNLAFVVYQHPFFTLVWREGGAWKFDEAELRRSMPHVELPDDVSENDMTSWMVVDLHRYTLVPDPHPHPHAYPHPHPHPHAHPI